MNIPGRFIVRRAVYDIICICNCGWLVQRGGIKHELRVDDRRAAILQSARVIAAAREFDALLGRVARRVELFATDHHHDRSDSVLL